MSSSSSAMPLLEFGKEYFADKRKRVIRHLDDRSDEEDVSGKIVIVTGSNTGIGKITASEMAKRGAIVVMACRNLQKAQAAVEDIAHQVPNAKLVVMELDLSDLASIRKFVKEFTEKYPHLNILINNGGVFDPDRVLGKTKDGFEIHMGVNHLGPFLLTMLLLDHIKKGAPSRIVTVSSSLHVRAELNLDDLMLENVQSWGFSNWLGYGNSKLANILFMKELAKRLEGTKVTTYSLCPGSVNTEIGRNQSWYSSVLTSLNVAITGCSVEEGCQTTLFCAVSKNASQDSGKMYRFGSCWERATAAIDDELAAKLWDISENLVGLSHNQKSSTGVNAKSQQESVFG